jgi:phosphatidylglycerol:prolipoprotein diacylglycerol transferase
VFGRAACALKHDHPGAAASEGAWLAVAFPSPEEAQDWIANKRFGLLEGHTPRYDLGLLELLFTLVLAVVFAILWRRRLRAGMHMALLCLLYAPVRFALDFLRMPESDGGDSRYAALTPAQWSCIVLLGCGLGVLAHVRKQQRLGVDPAERVRRPDD